MSRRILFNLYILALFTVTIVVNCKKEEVEENVFHCNINSTYSKNYKNIIHNQVFDYIHPYFGKVKFVPIKDDFLLKICLSKNNIVIYEFPEYWGNIWNLESVDAVSFKDLNKDGIKDILLVTQVFTGAGPTAVVPFPVLGVYLSKEKEFVHEECIQEKINKANKKEFPEISDVINLYNTRGHCV